ncbi:MAG: twin-arginine translocation signal domain-containing protein, partial [Bacteroidota bacterium]
MKRRDFIKQVAGATAATVAMPYLLPSGRLFAQTNGRLANHVILVLFAGGIRHQEAIDQLYLAGSQNEDIPGNVLLNMFPGEVPADKIVFGLDANRPGEKPITPVLSQPLSQQGTLIAEMRTS